MSDKKDRQELPDLFGPAVGTGEDILLDLTGRYLWLALELIAGGSEGPRVECVSLRMGGDHMVDYLPSIYQGQDFTYRYLSIFNSLFQDMEKDIYDLPRKLETDITDEDMLSFLAKWLCLEKEGGAERLRELIPAERTRLADGLREAGYRVIPGEANFLLFCGEENLGRRLKQEGILIRDCRNFDGLPAGWYRTAVRTPAENRKLLEAVKRYAM